MDNSLAMNAAKVGGAPGRPAIAAVLLVSVVSLGVALISQFGFGLHPCELCLYQRIPYDVTIVVSLLALVFLRQPRWQATVLLLCGLAFAIGSGIAAFHAGVEQHWWPGLAECSGDTGANSLEALRAQLMATKVARCDEIAWSLFGVSMAGWNFLASSLYAVGSLAAARLLLRRQAA